MRWYSGGSAVSAISGARRGISSTPLPAHLCDSRRRRGPFGGGLLAHPGQDPLRRRQVLAFGPHLGQLLDQLFFQIVQLRAAYRDPLLHLGIHHAPDRREENEAADRNRRTTLPNDLHAGHCPTTSPSSLTRHHTRGPDQPESRWRSFNDGQGILAISQTVRRSRSNATAKCGELGNDLEAPGKPAPASGTKAQVRAIASVGRTLHAPCRRSRRR